MCEAEADQPDRRRFGFILHNVDRYQTSGPESPTRLFIVGTFEIPTDVLEREARGEPMDQVDHQYQTVEQPARGAKEAVRVLNELLAGRKLLQPLQDERTFEPPILL